MAASAADSAETTRLLREVRAGDARARDHLFARHRSYLHRFVDLRIDPLLRTRVEPSDVVQEAQLEAVRRLDDFLKHRPLPFRLWLRQIAYDRLVDLHRHHVRAKKRSAQRDVALPDRSSMVLGQQLIDPGSAPSERLTRRELAQRVNRALAQLSDADRELVLMRNFEGLSNQESAQLLQVEPATASQRYGRALLRLRKLLTDQGLPESHHE